MAARCRARPPTWRRSRRRGQTLDARADVYAAGVVFAEMVSPDGIKSYQSRQSVWEGVRSEPAKLPDTPWAPVIQKAVKKDREGRYNSAHTLTRALEDVTLRVEGADDLHPYPGLASFTESDAEYFFGREAEVEQLWRKLEGPARMLGIMGPSGAGKSSFIAAGLAAHAPTNWGILRTTPGNKAIASLRSALTPELAGETTALQEMMANPEDPGVIVGAVHSWGKQHARALLVVDQLEELFTQNTAAEQHRFAELLKRFVLEANVHVLLSMRDDFAAACNAHESLRPIFHELTVLDPPTGANLRRAIVQPAQKCGYRFEDDELVDEMLDEVEGERGALPLLAFAAARLWEKRDRETGLLTRQAYKDIGGVGGALARHAEATIDRIGSEHIAIVRELFRNLVTAEGTRAVREWDELLSIFSDSQSESQPEEVLRQLIDARLLTSYEVREADEAPTRRVEIIHESLLANWPRLVRWQTQDADAAQLRDQLREAAKTWDEHDRNSDYFWTGKAYREFSVWRENYPGGLTELEDAFARSMTQHAKRRKRRRRVAGAAGLVVLLGVAAATTMLWRRSQNEALRAEAANLVSLGQLQLESYPTATVAHAIASLELADSRTARLLALEALWKGPTAMIASDDASFSTAFSPDGEFLLNTMQGLSDHIQVFAGDGSTKILDQVHEGEMVSILSVAKSGHFTTYGVQKKAIALWSAQTGAPLARMDLTEEQRIWDFAIDVDNQRAVFLIQDGHLVSVDMLRFDGGRERLGSLDFDAYQNEDGFWTLRAYLDRATGSRVGVFADSAVYVVELLQNGIGDLKQLGRNENMVTYGRFDPHGRFLAMADNNGSVLLWDLKGGQSPRVLEGLPDISFFRIAADGSRIEIFERDEKRLRSQIWSGLDGDPKYVRSIEYGPRRGYQSLGWNSNATVLARGGPDELVRVWNVDAPPDAAPLSLLRGNVGYQRSLSFEPKGSNWLATADASGLALWPLKKTYPVVLQGHDSSVSSVVFEPQGRWLASGGEAGDVRIWPLGIQVHENSRLVFDGRGDVRGLAVSPDSSQLLIGAQTGVIVAPIDGSPPTSLPSFTFDSGGIAYSADGALAAGVGIAGTSQDIVVWDTETWEEKARLTPGEDISIVDPHFMDDGTVLWSGFTGLHRVDVGTGDGDLLFEGIAGHISVSDDERRVATTEADQFTFDASEQLWILDLESGSKTLLESHGDRLWDVEIDSSGTFVVTGDKDGIVRVGPVTGAEPHVLFGHEKWIWKVDIDPQGRWIASASGDGTIRLWPMPDLSKPPLHTLPREELIAKLKTLTNLRVVRDPESATGWKLTHDPFPGWETVPTW